MNNDVYVEKGSQTNETQNQSCVIKCAKITEIIGRLHKFARIKLFKAKLLRITKEN